MRLFFSVAEPVEATEKIRVSENPKIGSMVAALIIVEKFGSKL